LIAFSLVWGTGRVQRDVGTGRDLSAAERRYLVSDDQGKFTY
jgi:hypothetical protein